MNPNHAPSRKHEQLEAAATGAGVFRILAVDHRGALLKLIDRDGAGHIAPERVTNLKLDLVRALAPLATAVILDPQYSIQQAIASDVIPAGVGLIASLPNAAAGHSRQVFQMAETFTVADARQVGAIGAKLYLAYHPDAGEQTAAQERLVESIVDQCEAEKIPLFLEPVLASIDPTMPVDSAEFSRQRRRLAIRTAERLGALGPDILKLEFPVDCRHETDVAAWSAACSELTATSPVPWALLSGGSPLDVFKTQLQIACEAGCCGYIVGRSLWSDAATADEHDRKKVLEKIAPRMESLNKIADQYGRDWRIKCAAS